MTEFEPGVYTKTASENNILSACLQLLHVWGCDVVRCNTGSAKRSYTLKSTGQTKEYNIRFGKSGMGDIIGCSPYGRWIEVECKDHKGKHKDHQKRRQQEIERRGGVYILARSPDDVTARKAEVLAKHYPAGVAENAIHNDFRLRSTSAVKRQVEEFAV